MATTKKRVFLKKIGVKLIALGLIMAGGFVMIDLSFRPIVETVNAYECHAAVSEVINQAVLAELEREDTDYSKLVNLTTNAQGEVVSLESNVMNINKLKTEIAARIEREIERLSAVKIQIPIGTLMGIQLLHGKGFDVGVSVKPLGYATTTIISEFENAGINQTLHRIVIRIDANVDAVIPGISTRVPVSTTVVAAETVIVGRVPNAYTHVVTTEELGGKIIDYDAVVSE